MPCGNGLVRQQEESPLWITSCGDAAGRPRTKRFGVGSFISLLPVLHPFSGWGEHYAKSRPSGESICQSKICFKCIVKIERKKKKHKHYTHAWNTRLTWWKDLNSVCVYACGLLHVGEAGHCFTEAISPCVVRVLEVIPLSVCPLHTTLKAARSLLQVN